MKTLQELYSEITANDELKKAFAEAAKDNKIVEFAKEHGVETSVDEIKTFLEAQAKNEKELSPEELENAAGVPVTAAQGLKSVFPYLALA